MMSTVAIYPNYSTACREVASHIARLVRQKPDAVPGLATGSTSVGVYQELTRPYHGEGLDFSTVTCFNLDEHPPMESDASKSYHRFMRNHLFDHINYSNWHVPSRQLKFADVESHFETYKVIPCRGRPRLSITRHRS